MVRGTYHPGGIALQFVIIAHNPFAGLIFHLHKVICHIMSGIVMDKPVIKTSNDILEGSGNPALVYADRVTLPSKL
jgi:hypothetical protein